MKVILLAGGFGTRLVEYTKIIPKPMIIDTKTIMELIIFDSLNMYAGQ